MSNKKTKGKRAEEENKPQFVSVNLDTGQIKGMEDFVDTQEAGNSRKKGRKKTKQAEEPVLSKRDESKIEKELQEIYENEDGTMPDMKKIQRTQKGRLLGALFFLFLSLFFLGAVAWLGFFVFQPGGEFAEQDVILSISGDEQVVLGQKVHYRIRYQNAQDVNLDKAALQVRYPQGFVWEKSTPEPTGVNHDEWDLGAIAGQNGGFIDMEGRLYGNIKEKQSLRVFFNYIPANFSSEFQKVATFTTEINGSPVEISLQSPNQAQPGVPAELTVILNKKGEEAVNNLALVLEPGSFGKVKSEPESDPDNQYQWSIPSLDGEKKIIIKGIFQSADEKQEDVVNFKIVGWKDEKRESDSYVYLENPANIKLVKSDLSADLAINGSTADSAVQAGDMLNTSIIVKNEGEEILKNVSVRFVIDVPSFKNKSLLNWSKLEDAYDGNVVGEQRSSDVRRGTITWDAKQIPTLRALEKGKQVAIDLGLPLKSSDETNLSQFTSFKMNAVAEVRYEGGGQAKVISSNPVNMVVNSDLKFDSRSEISKNQDGKSVYKITWLVNNIFHGLKEMELESDVYGDISWSDAGLTVPAGEAKFDLEKKKLTWKIPVMPTTVDVLALQFQIILNTQNPSQTNLTSKVRVKAHDVITNQDIVLAGDEILLK